MEAVSTGKNTVQDNNKKITDEEKDKSNLSLEAREKNSLPPKGVKSLKNLLVIRSGALGDVLMTTPLLRQLKKGMPETKITYLVGKWSASILNNNPNIDEIITFDEEIIFKKKIFSIVTLANQLRKKKFDSCIILDKSRDWTIFCKAAFIPFVVGFEREGQKNNFANIKIPFTADRNEIEHYLDIAMTLGLEFKDKRTELFCDDNDKAIVYELIDKHQLNKRSTIEIDSSTGKKKFGLVIGIAPGGAKNPGQEFIAKRWPEENYAVLITKLVNHGHKILLFGGKDDSAVCEKLKNLALENDMEDERIINFAGITNIQQTYLLMKACDYFVTHDSGPMHIAGAAGLDSRLICIFGPTSAKRFAPLGATVIQAKKLPEGYDTEQDIYLPISPESIEYASTQQVIKLIDPSIITENDGMNSAADSVGDEPFDSEDSPGQEKDKNRQSGINFNMLD